MITKNLLEPNVGNALDWVNCVTMLEHAPFYVGSWAWT